MRLKKREAGFVAQTDLSSSCFLVKPSRGSTISFRQVALAGSDKKVVILYYNAFSSKDEFQMCPSSFIFTEGRLQNQNPADWVIMKCL